MMGNIQLITIVSAFLLCGLVTNISAQSLLSVFSKSNGRLPTPEEGCGISKIANSKIVGGKPAKNAEYPWMAVLGFSKTYNFTNFECGGSLITSRHVLTAAHCLTSNLAFVRLGEYDLFTLKDGAHEDIKIIKAEKHHKYDEKKMIYDIGIITLERDVVFNDRIRPICLPLTNKLMSNSYLDTNPFIAGWGRLGDKKSVSNVLMHVQIPVIDNEACKDLYEMRMEYTSKHQFSEKVLCAGYFTGGKDSCDGDSGGPLMLPIQVKETFPMYQIGIVSWGAGCGQKYSPGIYTRVSYYIDWIKERVNKDP